MECELHGRGLSRLCSCCVPTRVWHVVASAYTADRGGRGNQEGLTPNVTVSEDGAWKEAPAAKEHLGPSLEAGIGRERPATGFCRETVANILILDFRPLKLGERIHFVLF